MTHFLCPLCGKYASRKNWNPEEYDYDIYSASFIGLGRGKGFECSLGGSLLGDDDVTPKTVDRMTSFLKNMVEDGIVTRESLLIKLGLDTVPNKGEAKDLELTKLREVTLLADLHLRERELSSLSVINSDLRRDNSVLSSRVEEMEKEIRLERIKSGIILGLQDFCDYHIEFIGASEWKFVIHEIFDEKRFDFIQFFIPLPRDVIRSIWGLLKPSNLYVETQLKVVKDLLEKMKKPISERLLETGPREIMLPDGSRFECVP